MTCELISNEFGYFVQFVLSVSSLIFLVMKYYFEDPRRPLHVWFKDTTKQGTGMIIAHCMNIWLSIYLQNPDESTDECDNYFINYNVDLLLGITMYYGMLRGCKYLTQSMNKEEIWYKITDTGNYHGECCIFLCQSVLWWMIIIITKLFIFWSFIYPLQSQWLTVGHYLLHSIANENKKLTFVMIIDPLIMNTIQIMIQDLYLRGSATFVKNKRLKYRLLNVDEDEYCQI